MGITPRSIHHILIAEKEGLGTTNLQQVKINDGLGKFRMQFLIKKTLLDRAATLLFNSETLSQIIFDSSFTPLIYKVAEFLRNPEEKDLANQMRRYY